MISRTGSSLVNGNGTPAYAGPYALPLSARTPLAGGANAVNLRFNRADAALDPVVYQVGVTRLPAPEIRIVAGTDLATGNPYHHDFGDFAVGGG